MFNDKIIHLLKHIDIYNLINEIKLIESNLLSKEGEECYIYFNKYVKLLINLFKKIKDVESKFIINSFEKNTIKQINNQHLVLLINFTLYLNDNKNLSINNSICCQTIKSIYEYIFITDKVNIDSLFSESKNILEKDRFYNIIKINTNCNNKFYNTINKDELSIDKMNFNLNNNDKLKDKFKLEITKTSFFLNSDLKNTFRKYNINNNNNNNSYLIYVKKLANNTNNLNNKNKITKKSININSNYKYNLNISNIFFSIMNKDNENTINEKQKDYIISTELKNNQYNIVNEISVNYNQFKQKAHKPDSNKKSNNIQNIIHRQKTINFNILCKKSINTSNGCNNSYNCPKTKKASTMLPFINNFVEGLSDRKYNIKSYYNIKCLKNEKNNMLKGI